MKQVMKYMSFDDKEFNSEEECVKYEMENSIFELIYKEMEGQKDHSFAEEAAKNIVKNKNEVIKILNGENEINSLLEE